MNLRMQWDLPAVAGAPRKFRGPANSKTAVVEVQFRVIKVARHFRLPTAV